MDRIEAFEVFVAVADSKGFSAAARQLGYSPAAVTRAVAFLENSLGTRLLHRTTRSVHLTEAGERLLVAGRRVLSAMTDAEMSVSGERLEPRGTLVVTAPVRFGTLRVLPCINAYLKKYPDVQVRLLLLDRVVNMIDEGIDVSIRIGHLPESNLVAQTVGEIRRVVCASPDYLDGKKAIREPSDLQDHSCIAFTQITQSDTWTFSLGSSKKGSRQVRIKPRLSVNSAEAAIVSAKEGNGVICVLSYQVESEIGSRKLKLLLEKFSPPPIPVHVVFPEARLTAAKSRAFIDMLVPALRREMRWRESGRQQ